MKPVVGHLVRKYLGLTETFIHVYLANQRQFSPLVLTDISQNLDVYPAPCADLTDAHEMVTWAREMGARFPSYIQAFFAELDFPNCFERFIRERDIRILHAHFGPMGLKTLELKRRLKLPLVTTFYGIDASKWLSTSAGRMSFQRLFYEGDLFLAVGEDMARRLREAGCPAEKIQIYHLGIDLKKIPFRSRHLPSGKEPIVLLYCGRLVEKKGVLFALLAFARLADKWKRLVFRIVGDGPFRQTVWDTVRRLDLQDRVVLRGALPHQETLREMQQAHLFVLPSVTAPDGDMEGSPVVLIEAQAAGLPVVSTHHADIPEVVLDGKTGFLVPEYNSQALADCLDSLLTQSEIWPELGMRGRLHMEQHYDVHREVGKMEAHYQNLMHRLI